MTAAERTHLVGIHAAWQRLKDYLDSAPLDLAKASAADWHEFLVILLKLQGNPARDLHFVGRLLARDYLVDAFELPPIDVMQSPSSSKDWDIDVTTPDSKRIIGLGRWWIFSCWWQRNCWWNSSSRKLRSCYYNSRYKFWDSSYSITIQLLLGEKSPSAIFLFN